MAGASETRNQTVASAGTSRKRDKRGSMMQPPGLQRSTSTELRAGPPSHHSRLDAQVGKNRRAEPRPSPTTKPPRLSMRTAVAASSYICDLSAEKQGGVERIELIRPQSETRKKPASLGRPMDLTSAQPSHLATEIVFV